MASAGARDASPPPPAPPPAADPAADSDAGSSPKKKGRVAVTEAQRSLEQLRQLRAEQKKILADLRKRARQQRRRISALNKKASKVSLQELMEITCIKHQMLMEKGELPAAEAADAAASDAPMDPGEAFAAVAALAAKRKNPTVT